MRSIKYLLTAAAIVVGMSLAAHAELQNVEVGGSLRIRGNYFDGKANAIINNSAWVEQRTRLNVKADFTDEVTAFIEFDHYHNWGEDFRSDYVTGLDFRGTGDVALYQAYIEANDMWGVPLRARIGRQELAFGSQFMIGVNDTASGFAGLSFDAIRLTYDTDMFSVDAVWAKLAEDFGDIFDDDTDMYAIYGSYKGLEDIVIDAYWIWVRDDNPGTLPVAGINNVLDVDVHTIGLRGAGTIGAFDFEAEAAYQWGEIDRPRINFFRKGDFDYGEWALNLELGYTFDMVANPRVFAGFAYLGGSDPANSQRRNFGRFGLRGGSVDLSFNRLFSNWEYTEFFANTDETNMLIYRLGLSAMPTESLEVSLVGAYFQVDDEAVLRRGIFRETRAGDSLGYEVGLYADYNYTEDLVFRVGYAHFFGRSGMFENNAVIANGLARVFADSRSDDWNYLFFETEISF